MNLLETSNLSVGFGEKEIFTNINIQLKPGEVVGLIGQNGVGKSTLIRTLCGLQRPLSGEICVNERPIKSYSKRQLSLHVSLVLTGRVESMNLSVIELIALGRYPYSGWLGILSDTDKVKIEKAMDQMQIQYLGKKKLFELSDGQLQKVMIARALAQDTRLLVLDEPTSHLDLRNKIEVMELLKKIANIGKKSILISTHEVAHASRVCDTFWCMDFDKEIETGIPKKLIEKGIVQNYLHVPYEALTKK